MDYILFLKKILFTELCAEYLEYLLEHEIPNKNIKSTCDFMEFKERFIKQLWIYYYSSYEHELNNFDELSNMRIIVSIVQSNINQYNRFIRHIRRVY